MGVNIEAISVLAELELNGVPYQFAGGDEVRITCPFHAEGKEKNPSCHVNTVTRLFKCQTAGCTDGTIIKLLSRIQTKSQTEVILDLGKRYDIEDEKVIDFGVIERWHAEIWKADVLRNELYKRGLTDDNIRRYRLGETEGRISIPISNRSGLYVNVRKYQPGAPGKLKMKNSKGFSKTRLYPIDQLKYDTIVLTGGECKAIVGLTQLNPHNIGCITTTASEQNVFAKNHELLQEFRDKTVYVCMDIDEPGVIAAEKIAQTLRMVAKFVGVMKLPLDKDKYPKGDINDFIASEKGNLLEVLQATEEYKASVVDKLAMDYQPPIEMALSKAVNADNINTRMKVNVVISAMDTNPYLVPKDVEIICDRDQAFCATCPVYCSGKSNFTIPPESPSILEFVGSGTSSGTEIVKSAIGIPRGCKVCEFAEISAYNVQDTRVSPQLEISDRNNGVQPVAAFAITDNLSVNESYNMTGRLVAHPKTQQATLLISEVEPAQDALSSYHFENMEDLENELGIFWPDEWTVEGIDRKMKDIYSDFAYNVTGIYERDEIHLITDLAYHSPLYIQFDGKVEKGWVEAIIVGDSGQGKSFVTSNLQAHYKVGGKLECKNSTVAGILGGLEKMGERWFVTWGAVPRFDRRLLIFEEVKGTDPQVIAKLTDMRSSGFAEINKIGCNRKTHARTRSVWVSNPRNSLEISQHTYGITAIKELIGSLEDVRRFDIALIVGKNEVDPWLFNLKRDKREHVPHRYTSDACHKLVLWAWTRGEHDVEFDADAVDFILESATQLSEEFSDAVPLVDRGSIRYKIARLAAAIAARTFSVKVSEDETIDSSKLSVYKCHAEYVVQFLRSIYSRPTFGYTQFTEAQKLMTTLLAPDELKSAIELTPHPKDFCKNLLSRDFIEKADLADWTTLDGMGVQNILSLFVRKHALVRKGKAYVKTSKFIELLKAIMVDMPETSAMHASNLGKF